MKKLLLTLGAVAAVVAPVASVVACGSSSTFTEPTGAKKAALDDLAAKIQANTDLKGIVVGDLNKSELNGNTARFTYLVTPTADASDDTAASPDKDPVVEGTRITVDLDKGEITKMEVKVSGAFKDGTDDMKGPIASANASLKADFAAAKEVISPASTETPKSEVKIDVKDIMAADIVDPTNPLDNGLLTVKVTTDTDDFESGVSAKIAQAVQATILNSLKTFDEVSTQLKLVKSIKVYVIDGKTPVKAAEATVNVSATADPRVGVNKAINSVSKAIAESGYITGDQAASDTDYATDMVARINAVSGTSKTDNANNLLKAIGNATVFDEETKTTSAFGIQIDWAEKFPTTNIKKLLTAIFTQSGTDNAAIKTAFLAQIDKLLS